MITSVPMGEIRLTRETGVLRSLLGSCVGIALYQPETRTAVLSHTLLSDSTLFRPSENERSVPPGRYVDTAIDEMLRRLRVLRERPSGLLAHVAGGADMFGVESADAVGRLNCEAVIRQLSDRHIDLVSEHCGGTVARRMSIDASNGGVRIEEVETPPTADVVNQRHRNLQHRGAPR
ncbi:MAG: chemotaxis protein CheD [Planctomycetota bacterium]